MTKTGSASQDRFLSLLARETGAVSRFVTARELMKGYMVVRDRYVGTPPPASTLVIVSGFTRPEFLVEVEVVAASSS